MRIGLFSDTYLPEINGVSASLHILAEQLIAQGHSVHVFVPYPKKLPRPKYVYRLPSVPLILLKERSFVMYGFRTSAKALKIKYDIIHTHTEFGAGQLGSMVAHKQKIPMVHTYHTVWEEYSHYLSGGHTIPDKAFKKLIQKYSQLWCNKAEGIVVPTDKTKKILESYGIKRKFYTIPTGIDLSAFCKEKYDSAELSALRKSYGFSEDDIVIVYVGRISKEKNIEEVMHALPHYMKKQGNIRFLIVGEGPNAEHLKKLAQELGIGDKVVFAGPKPWKEIGKYYRIGNIFTSASKSETQGLTYIEAMASGLCVVARYDLCLEGVIESGVDGYLFDDQNPIYQAFDQAFANYEQIGQAAEQSVQKFSKENFGKTMEKTYLEVIENYPKEK